MQLEQLFYTIGIIYFSIVLLITLVVFGFMISLALKLRHFQEKIEEKLQMVEEFRNSPLKALLNLTPVLLSLVSTASGIINHRKKNHG